MPPDSDAQWMETWVHQRVQAAGYDNLWNPHHSKEVLDWLKNPGPHSTLFVSCDGGSKLDVSYSIPEPSPTRDSAMFFIHLMNSFESELTPLTISKHICYGSTKLNHTMDSLMKMFVNIHAPHMIGTVKSKSSRDELLHQLDECMRSFTERCAHKPYQNDHLRDPDVLLRLEKEIKNELESKIGVVSEAVTDNIIESWKERHDKLTGLLAKLKYKEGDNEESTLIAQQLQSCILSLKRGVEEAEDNIKHLGMLTSTIRDLYNTTKPGDVPALLSKILNQVRLISKVSKYFNTKQLVSVLLRSVSCSLVSQCRKFLAWKDICYGSVESVIKQLEIVVQCGTEWKLALARTKEAVRNECKTDEKETGRLFEAWNFCEENEEQIFSPMDAFTMRCQEILELCMGRLQFTSISDSFDGMHGPEYKLILESLPVIEKMFGEEVSKLATLDYDPFDPRAAKFFNDFDSFKEFLGDLDSKYIEIVDKSFEMIPRIDASIQLLDIVKGCCHRPNIEYCIQRHISRVRALFITQCQSVRKEFDEQARDPPLLKNEPKHAGAATWARSLLERLSNDSMLLEESYKSEETTKEFEAISEVFSAYEHLHNEEFIESLLSFDIKQMLDQPIIEKDGAKTICNFPAQLLLVFEECNYWEKHTADNLEIPHDILSLCQRREDLRISRERVSSVTRMYNDLQSSIDERERRIFADQLKRVNNALRPGLTGRIVWACRPSIIERYTSAAIPEINNVSRAVKQFKMSLSTIYSCCNQIKSMPFVSVETNATYEKLNFQHNHEKLLDDAKRRLLSLHQSIENELKDLVKAFENSSHEVHRELHLLVMTIDENVKLALEHAVKKSLLNLCMWNNDVGVDEEDNSIFSTDVTLRNEIIECKPSLIDLTNALNKIIKDVILTAQSVPSLYSQLSNDLKVQSNQPKEQQLYRPDDKTNTILEKIMDEMKEVTTAAQKGLSYWDKYSSCHDDSHAYARKAVSDNFDLQEIQHQIGYYEELKLTLAAEEVSNAKGFVRLDFSPLIASMLSLCDEWIGVLMPLKENAEEKASKCSPSK